MIANNYLFPQITKETVYKILSVLLLINVFRYLPLSLFMPGQVGADFPNEVRNWIAFGDLISGLLSLTAYLVWQRNKMEGIFWVWTFSIISSVDIISVLYIALSNKVYLFPLGANYFTVVLYVPLLIVIQYVIFKILLSKKQLL